MTDIQKSKIQQMRGEGVGYSQIAAAIGASENTVKTYCRRNNLTNVSLQTDTEKEGFCKNCGKQIVRNIYHKPKKFCSDKCRLAWWGKHRDKTSSADKNTISCACCGAQFNNGGNKNRKYCGHACYIKHRFENGGNSDVK